MDVLGSQDWEVSIDQGVVVGLGWLPFLWSAAGLGSKGVPECFDGAAEEDSGVVECLDESGWSVAAFGALQDAVGG